MFTQLLKILRESIKAVPAMKYALAVAGVLAVVAMVGAFKLSPQAAVFGTVIMLVLMVAMVIFARLTTTAPRHFFLPVTIMMWAFLVVTVGTAFLLFTSAFFQWPRGLRELLDPKGAPPSVRAQPAEPRELIAAAQVQRRARDYEGAWTTIGRALAFAPESRDAGDEQMQIAMAWLRDLHVPDRAAYATAVPPLSACLYQNVARTEGQLAADIHAHIGWANFLRSKAGVRNLAIEEEYARAVALDPANPFAHAMWGHWLATQRRPLTEIRDHFRIALKSGRERPYVHDVRVAALTWFDTLENSLELMRIADEMRRDREPIDPGLRNRIYSATYATLGRNHETEVLEALPAPDNLATFRWVTDGRDLAASAIDSYLLARLTEAAGDLPTAASLYRTLLPQGTVFEDRIEAGLARCTRYARKP